MRTDLVFCQPMTTEDQGRR